MQGTERDNLTSLTSGEIAALWNIYDYESMSGCFIHYFLQHVLDNETKEILESGLDLVNKRINTIEQILKEEKYPKPLGYTNEDVNLDAPRLFSDVLYLDYILNTLEMELVQYSLAFRECAKLKLSEFFHEATVDSQLLEMRAKKTLKKKGLYIKAPHVPTPKQVKFVEKENFLSGWLGKKRPLLAVEISQLVFHAQRNALGQAVITGFSQVAQSKEVQRFFVRGRDIAGKHVDLFTKVLHEDFLPNASVLKTDEVTDSTESPFSERMMLNFITKLIAASIGGYGISMSLSPRQDLSVLYARLAAEVAQFAADGSKLMIKNGWLQQPPAAANRRDLAT